MNARYRPIVYAVAALAGAWLLAMAGYALSGHWKMTVEKLRAYITGVDFSQLSGDARRRALRELEDKINALPPEERQKARIDQLWARWFNEMTEAEKSEFLNATLPSGFKQMLSSFEKLPEEKRKLAIDNALKNLQTARQKAPQTSTNAVNTNRPVMSEDLQKQVAVIGLKSVYTEGSAETKAELAPLLEEVQKNMEMGRSFRGGR